MDQMWPSMCCVNTVRASSYALSTLFSPFRGKGSWALKNGGTLEFRVLFIEISSDKINSYQCSVDCVYFLDCMSESFI